MHPLVYLPYLILELYGWVLIIWIILSWLIQFNVINAYNPVIQKVNYVFSRLIEPVLRPLRKRLPNLGGVDLAPIVLIIAIQFIKYCLNYYSYKI